MLVDLNKDEIKYLVNILSLNNAELMNKEEAQFSSNLYIKLRNISNACTYKEDNLWNGMFKCSLEVKYLLNKLGQ